MDYGERWIETEKQGYICKEYDSGKVSEQWGITRTEGISTMGV